jgi:acyl transferase domain-containing protein/acyl carrier protein
MMEPVIQRFVDYVTRVRLQAPSIPYIANVTGAWITAAQATDPAYWGAHLRNTVRFAEGVGTLLSDSYSIVLEVGPGESLPALISASDTRRGTAHLVETMRPAAKTVNDHEYWLTALAKLWVNNVRLDWKGIHAGQRRVRISLPTYPFERQRYWVERNGAVTPDAVAKTPGRKQDIADWFYLPSWKRTIPPPSKTVQPENWLVFAAESEFARAMTAGLRPRGRVFEVHAGSRFAVRSADCFDLAPESREDYVSLFSQLASAGDLPRRILYEWQSDSPESSLTAVLYALQAIIENLPGVPIEFNLVTDRACSVFGERITSPAGGAVNAFCRVAPLENADFKVRTIDVDADTDPETMARQVLRELEAEAQNQTVAYRHSSRWEQHFQPVRLEPGAEPGIMLRAGGTYLITGGTGGVGLALAEYIARRTQGNLVLTGRSLIPAEEQWAALLAAPDTDAGLRNKILRLQRIREAGGQTTLLQADVADTNAMHRVMVDIQQRFGPVHGIIHAAAIVQPGLVQAKEPELMKSVLAPKVQGTAWLRSAIADGKLDFVLLCSSISSVLPTVGLADYAAANAWLDGLATELDSPLGTRVISVNWDAWRDVGMVADLRIPPYLVSRYRENLNYAIGSDEAAEIFDRLLNCPVSQIVISTWDMHERMEISARFAQAASGELNHTLKSSQRAVTEFTGRDEEIDAEVIELWRELLGTTFIGANDNFFELGGHSLLAAQMLSRIRERFRINLPLKTIFEAATPAEIADRIRVMRWAISIPSQEQAETGEREEIEL